MTATKAVVGVAAVCVLWMLLRLLVKVFAHLRHVIAQMLWPNAIGPNCTIAFHTQAYSSALFRVALALRGYLRAWFLIGACLFVLVTTLAIYSLISNFYSAHDASRRTVEPLVLA